MEIRKVVVDAWEDGPLLLLLLFRRVGLVMVVVLVVWGGVAARYW